MIHSSDLTRLKPLIIFILLAASLLIYTIIPSRKPTNLHPHIKKSLIIASTTSSNLTWLTPSLLQTTNWTPHIYITDHSPSNPHLPSLPSKPLTIPHNKGNEAMPYLTHIISSYPTLSPDSVLFFHHHHFQSWHQLYPSTFELAKLNPLSVLKQGYLTPRCLPGCENVIELPHETANINQLRGVPREIQISSLLSHFMSLEYKRQGRGEYVLPKKIAAPCCAQFAVSEGRVKERSLELWEGLREWLVETNLDDSSAGKLLEWTWHLWFGVEDVFCPSEKQCLCDVYGIGDCGKEL